MVPLTVRSYYSLMWGTCSPQKLCTAAKQRGYNRLALTDTDNLYGLWPFLKSCKQAEITPIVGAELTDPVRDYRAVCLVENDQGYRNLCRLITRRHSDERFDLKTDLPAHAAGLVILTQSGELLLPWYEAGLTLAAAVLRQPTSAALRLRQVARHLDVPLVATPGSFFLDPEDAEIHRMLRAIDLNTLLSRLTSKDAAPLDAWLASPAEYAERFNIWPDAVQATAAIAERLPWFWRAAHTGDDLLTRLKQLPELARIDFPAPWPQIIRTAQRIIGVPRHLSVHPGGVVITPQPLHDYVPVEPAPKGVPIIQWEKDAAEESGLVKIDLLGNRSLGVIRDAIANLEENGRTVNEVHWEPEDDSATQQSVARGDTMGCFYIESPPARRLQKKAGVGDFEHLVIHSSIIRPAANEFIREYVRRLHGGQWEPIHPLLADVLDETYGIMVYQEDVSKTAVAMAGFSHADADGLRKIMSKKDKARKLDDYKARFTAGAQARGVTAKQIEAVWDMMMSFSGYSFCKPHSASYARVSYQAAYLKTHYPTEFMAAVISNQGGFYSTFAYVSEARRLGVKILSPDVNQSDVRWKGNTGTVRVGLLSLKHLSADTSQRIVDERQTAPYQNLTDFIARVRPDDPEVRSLIHAGAFESLYPGKSRAMLLWELACLNRSRAGRPSTGNLFAINPDVPRPLFPPENKRERLRNEFAVLGFLCDRHPMVLYADTLQSLPIVKARDLPRFVGRSVSVAGLLITGKVVYTKHGDPMEFLTFEDETGLVETTFFPKVYRRFCALLDRSHPFILSGKVAEDFGAVTLTVKRVERIPKTEA